MQLDRTDFSEWYNTIVKEAELADLRYSLKGFVVFMPWSVSTMKRMYSIYEEELEKNGHAPAWFPSLIPEDSLKKEAEHVEGFSAEAYWVTHAGKNQLEQRYAMRPTSEMVMYPMYALWIQGVKDLPLKIYQSCQVWRYETKATRPFIRSREFHWIEAHNVFATEADAFAQVKEDMQMAENVIHRKFGIPFLFFKRPQWDKFAGAVDTYAADSLMPDGKALQLPSTHMLGQNFSKAVGLKYMDEKGNAEYGWQTCYGPCISRIYSALISIHGDDKGLVLPFDLAPVQVVIVPIYKNDNNAKVDDYCVKMIETHLVDYKAKYDSSNERPGFKFNYWEMKGVPIRLEIGERDMAEGCVMLFRRDKKEKCKVKLSELNHMIEEVKKDILTTLVSNADAWFNKMLHKAKDIEELNIYLERGGFARVAFCTDRKEGEACADAIKEKTHGNVRGSLFDSEEVPKNEKCVVCGKKATIYQYVARQY
ncbi:MAG: proline--tRNA ligase [Candidatus Micrarchaeota archaeon]